MLRDRTCTKADLKEVARKISDMSADELDQAGFTVEQARRLMAGLLRENDAITVLDRATPIAALVIQPVDRERCQTFFIATDAFFSGILPTRFLRRLLDQRLAGRHAGMAIESTTYSSHPQLLKWYRLMGYSLKEQDGRRHVFLREPE